MMTKRKAVTILEVLFAVLVAAVGLLAALSLVTVAGTVARKARVSDTATTAAQHALSLARMDAGVSRNPATGQPCSRDMLRPAFWFAWDSTTNQFVRMPMQPNGLPATLGESYCIDPRFIAANSSPALAPGASAFPYSAAATDPRMRRVTLDNGAGAMMNRLVADSIFVLSDDLNYSRPDDGARVAEQVHDSMPGGGTAARRQVESQFSWLATLCPKIERYSAVSVANNPEYILSIVVFNQRRADLAQDADTERIVDIAFPGGGITGGEVQLTDTQPIELHRNDWILVGGFSQRVLLADGITQSLPQPVFLWYRVDGTEAEESNQTYATLDGQDWDTTCTNPKAVIMHEVVAVLERTVRLRPAF
jgi:type II secretory pathway pseudopilin PulG